MTKLALSINQDTTIQDVEYLPYLTEKTLGEHLKTIFPNEEFINNKQVKESYITNRPDYYCQQLKLIVEFDGYRHFTNPKTVLMDIKKDKVYTDMGIKIIRIPYFIQLDTRTVEAFFNVNNWNSSDIIIHPHGFINPKAATPAYFCSLGVARFLKWYYRLQNYFDGRIEKHKYNYMCGEYVFNRSWWFQINVLNRCVEEIAPIENIEQLSQDLKYGGWPT